MRSVEDSPAGKTANNFAMELGGKSEHLSDLKGKVVVLNFWASWCPPCVNETPSMIHLQKYIESRGGVDVCFGGIGINGHIAFNEPPEPGESSKTVPRLLAPPKLVVP